MLKNSVEYVTMVHKTEKIFSQYLEKFNSSGYSGILVQFREHIVDLLTLWRPRCVEVQNYQ